jgi:hypothetical protein
MELELVMLSEISQFHKNKYVFSHLLKIGKNKTKINKVMKVKM